MDQDWILICTNADKAQANADAITAGLEDDGSGNMSVPLSPTGVAPATHWGAQVSATTQQSANLEVYFGAGNPYGRTKDQATDNFTFWDKISELSLQRIFDV